MLRGCPCGPWPSPAHTGRRSLHFCLSSPPPKPAVWRTLDTGWVGGSPSRLTRPALALAVLCCGSVRVAPRTPACERADCHPDARRYRGGGQWKAEPAPHPVSLVAWASGSTAPGVSRWGIWAPRQPLSEMKAPQVSPPCEMGLPGHPLAVKRGALGAGSSLSLCGGKEQGGCHLTFVASLFVSSPR